MKVLLFEDYGDKVDITEFPTSAAALVYACRKKEKAKRRIEILRDGWETVWRG